MSLSYSVLESDALMQQAPSLGAFLSAPLASATLDLVRGEGAWLYTMDGRRMLDFSSGTLNLPLGYGHPILISAAIQQLETGVYFHSSRWQTQAYVALASRLSELVPSLPVVHHKLCSGSDANETAMKLARKATGRRLIATQLESHLGETCETHSASGRDPGCKDPIRGSRDFVHFPPPTGGLEDIAQARDALRTYRGQLAAILVEPIPFRAGLLAFATTGRYLAGLRHLADEHDALLLSDEVQTFGWVDRLLATTVFHASPDVIALGKGLGFGFPLAAVLMRKELQHVLSYNDAELTPGGHVVSCAVAVAGLDVLMRENFEIDQKGALLESRLRAAFLCSGLMASIRRFGLMLGVTFPGDASEQDQRADQLYQGALRRGLILRRTGYALILKPPVIVDEAEICLAVDIVADAIGEVHGL